MPNRPRIELDQAITIAKDAFRPLECSAEGRDSGNKLQLSIRDASGSGSIQTSSLIRGQFTDPRRLKSNLNQLRHIIERRRKIELKPWRFPELPQGT